MPSFIYPHFEDDSSMSRNVEVESHRLSRILFKSASKIGIVIIEKSSKVSLME